MPISSHRPTIRHYPKKPPKPPVETDLKTLGDAANEAAKREAAQWFFFLTIMITLAALVGSTTHRVLFLEDPVKVPILGVELPLLGFYVAAPAIFVVLHFYLLAQLQLMAGKVNAFLDAVETETAQGSEHRERALRRLDSFSVAQLMAVDRFGHRSLPLQLMVSVTLVLAPLALLLFFQLRYLPHHTESITLWHQLLVAADLALLWWLWPLASGPGRCRSFATMTGSVCVVGFSWFLAVIPGDDPQAEPLSRARIWLFDGRTNPITQRPTSLFARRLVLLDQVFLTEAERKTWAETPGDRRDQIGRTRVLRGRDLRFAELGRANLHRADLTGARLTGADLSAAQMQGAILQGAQMQGANLRAAEMQGADLQGAQMQGANLQGAQMQGANLQSAEMQGANLQSAEIQGADLQRAQMQGSYLRGMNMQGANLAFAKMQGADLVFAGMQGANLQRAEMQGADLESAQMQGANLQDARMEGTHLRGAQIWRLRARSAETSEALLNAVDFDAGLPCVGSRFIETAGPCPREPSWARAVENWLARIPEGQAKRSAQRRLAILLQSEDPPEAARGTASWPQTATPDLGRVADLLGGFACAAEHAPHMARSVFHQILWPPPATRDLGLHRATLAARILQDDCVGAQSLAANERARLTRIAVGQN